MPVRPATAADLDDLAALFGAYLAFYEVGKGAQPVRAFLAERLRCGDSTILVATRDGAAVGFVQLYPLFESLALRPSLLLSDLFVDPGVRRQGIACQLLEAARRHALTRGACGLRLETAKSNRAAQALYERLGYVRDRVFHGYWLDLSRTLHEERPWTD